MKNYYKLTCVVLPAVMMVACSASGGKKPSATAVATNSIITQQPMQNSTNKSVETLADKINSTWQQTTSIEISEAEKFPFTQVATVSEGAKPEKRVYQFGFDKQEIEYVDQVSLQAHADYLIANPDTMLSVNGHSDTQGNSDYNLFLSQERANKISQFLIEYGVPEYQIETTGLGDSQPLMDVNSFKENRRVELQYNDSRVAIK